MVHTWQLTTFVNLVSGEAKSSPWLCRDQPLLGAQPHVLTQIYLRWERKKKIRSKWAKKKEKEEEEREKEMGRGMEEVFIFLINLINCEKLYMNSETYKKWQVHFYILVGWSVHYIFSPRSIIDTVFKTMEILAIK